MEAVVRWITAIPFEDWNQQKPHGVLPLKPAMMSNHTWHDFGETFDPLVADLMVHFPGCRTQQRMLSAVMAGDSIPPHTDGQPPQYVTRIHVPLMSNEQSFFIVEGIPHAMPVGAAYLVDTRKLHAVVNDGTTPRVHFMFDVYNASA